MQLITTVEERVVTDHKLTGAMVRAERKRLGISQTRLAELCGWNKSYQCELEKGRRDWDEYKLSLVTKALNGKKGSK